MMVELDGGGVLAPCTWYFNWVLPFLAVGLLIKWLFGHSGLAASGAGSRRSDRRATFSTSVTRVARSAKTNTTRRSTTCRTDNSGQARADACR
jgi:hypothetical protein